jgi:hypothetical protein
LRAYTPNVAGAWEISSERSASRPTARG